MYFLFNFVFGNLCRKTVEVSMAMEFVDASLKKGRPYRCQSYRFQSYTYYIYLSSMTQEIRKK